MWYGVVWCGGVMRYGVMLCSGVVLLVWDGSQLS